MRTLHDSLQAQNTGLGGLQYVILLSKPAGRLEEIVLAFTGHEHVQPFVTWRRATESGACYLGHYYSDLQRALDDYEDRS